MNEPPKNERMEFEQRNSVRGSKPESHQTVQNQTASDWFSVVRVSERTLSRYL